MFELGFIFERKVYIVTNSIFSGIQPFPHMKCAIAKYSKRLCKNDYNRKLSKH